MGHVTRTVRTSGSRLLALAVAVAGLAACQPFPAAAPPALAGASKPALVAARDGGPIRVVGRLAKPRYGLRMERAAYGLADIGRLHVRLLGADDVQLDAIDLEGPITSSTPIDISGLKPNSTYAVVVDAYDLDDTTMISVPATSRTPIDTAEDATGGVPDEITTTFALTLIERLVHLTAYVPVETGLITLDELAVQLDDDQGGHIVPATPGAREPFIWGGGTFTFELRDLRPAKTYHVQITGYLNNAVVGGGGADFTTPDLTEPFDDELTLPAITLAGV